MNDEQGHDRAAGLERVLPAPMNGVAGFVLLTGAALLLRELADLVVPLLLGVFLALLAWPMMAGLKRRHVGTTLALILTVFVVLGSVVAICAVIALSVGELVVRIPAYEDELANVLELAQTLLAQIGVTTDPRALLAIVSPDQMTMAIQEIAASVSKAGVAIVLIALTMVYLLAGASAFQTRAEQALGRDHPLIARATRFGFETRRFILVRAQLGAVSAVLSFALLLVLDVPLPALWALLVLAASFIPNIGFLFALIPPTTLALLDGGVGVAAAVVVGYGVINFVQDNFLQPMVLGAELNLTPFAVFAGFIAWTWVLGPVGSLMAVPLTIAVVEILEAFPATRAVAIQLRSEASGTPPAAERTTQ